MEIKNKLLKIIRTPLFKQRVVKDKTKYDRKIKNRKEKEWN
jgi:stalled ribosome alternative rescue factor ArfA